MRGTRLIEFLLVLILTELAVIAWKLPW